MARDMYGGAFEGGLVRCGCDKALVIPGRICSSCVKREKRQVEPKPKPKPKPGQLVIPPPPPADNVMRRRRSR